MAKKGKSKAKQTPKAAEPPGEKEEDATIPEVSSETSEDVPVAEKSEVKEAEQDPTAENDHLEALRARVQELELQLTERDTKSGSAEDADLALQLKEKTEEANRIQENYNTLLSKVSGMKTLFTKMKATETELEKSKSVVSELEKENSSFRSEMNQLKSDVDSLKTELHSVNSECQRFQTENSTLKEQLSAKGDGQEIELKQLQTSNKKLEMQLRESQESLEEYLILLQEEKVSKKSLTLEISDYKHKLESSQKEKEDVVAQQKALESQITELKSQVESSTKEKKQQEDKLMSEIESKLTQISQLDQEMSLLKEQLDEKNREVQEISRLEEELKQKQLQIGKLRHENIKCNEHLSKAMKLLKKNSNAETVDRELISNLFINFLQLDRGDSKKFEVLQLLSNFLNWDDEKKRHAGLLAGNSVPGKSKTNSVVDSPAMTTRGSFVSLWTEFLEKESATAPSNIDV